MNLTWVIIAAVAALVLLKWTFRIVQEYQRLVVFTLGKCDGQRGPGLVRILPFFQRAVLVDLRENFMEVAHQTCITKDNAPITIDFLLYWKVVDPVLTVIQVRNFAGAAQGIAMTTLRAVVGDIPLDDVLARREQINEVLRVKLDDITERWGVRVTNVEIREITPPKEIQDSMNKQMSAERNRRAVVLEADGTRSAAVTVAEGQKQAEILRAEGAARALALISEQAKNIDSQTLALQYMEALKVLGQGPSTKWIIPAELSPWLEGIFSSQNKRLKANQKEGDHG